jgi:hypothetical protein
MTLGIQEGSPADAIHRSHKPRRSGGFDRLDSKTPWKTTGLAKRLVSSSCERLAYHAITLDIKATEFFYPITIQFKALGCPLLFSVERADCY